MSASNPPQLLWDLFFFFNICSFFEACNYVVRSVIQKMVMIIIIIAERILESMCVVLRVIAFYF